MIAIHPVQYYIGTSGWMYNHWKGIFYPAEISKNDWFGYYCRCFSVVEVNATFYRRFKDDTFIKWKTSSPVDFKFVLKVPRIITHLKKLIDVRKEVTDFCRQAMLLEDKLGCLLLQLPPFISFQPHLLNETLNLFPDDIMVAVEFRNRIWLNNESEEILGKHSAIYCNTDSPLWKLEERLTTDTAYLRLHGKHRWYSYDYSQKDLMDIAGLMKRFLSNKIKTIYVFFNNDFGGYAPQNAKLLEEMLNKMESC
jgi:uncharacterized protein YecE (DUF72 family)